MTSSRGELRVSTEQDDATRVNSRASDFSVDPQPSDRTATPATFSDLFPENEVLRPEVAHVRRLLLKGSGICAHAKSAWDAERHVEADDAVHQLLPTLQRMFACRATLGDGFGMVVSALQGSIENLSEGVSRQQLTVIENAWNRLSEELFIRVDAAIDEVSLLEAAGLSPEPPGFDSLATALVDVANDETQP